MTTPRVATQPPRIVVVEDETDLAALLKYLLDKEGFRVEVASDGRQALRELRREAADLVLLDLMLPDVDGLDILREIKRTAAAARSQVIVLSARNDEKDRVLGLELGAADYVVKPFSPRELMLRIHGVLRTAPARDEGGGRLRAGPIEIDFDHHEARVDDKPIQLTVTEFRLLSVLVRNEGRVRSREALLTEVWGYDSEAMSRTIDTHVRRLRVKLGPAASWLTTVRGVGYRVRDPRRGAP